MRRLLIGLSAIVTVYYAVDRWLEKTFYTGKRS